LRPHEKIYQAGGAQEGFAKAAAGLISGPTGISSLMKIPLPFGSNRCLSVTHLIELDM